ncbi:hypothetical protein B0J13DRAFT_600022 [Dactylonectria estremocensis]|uniref:Uncharacterized protein n=1 Tax=Dactylonectria estremocensis TaxID=1079267 RepID=A0A9P9DAU1_9HYPO|nr:hypothetical protein B0J13DRAFT_600022 [Dactylonectria estremocensis]
MSKRYPAPTEERIIFLHQNQRDKSISWLADIIAGRDLVAITLSNDPSEILQRTGLRRAVLGRAAYSFDEEVFIKRISNGAYGTCSQLMSAAAVPDDGCMVPILDVFKLIMCDARCLEEGESLQNAYEAELREDELQTPTARAREIVRDEDEKTARRNAKLIIPHLERLSADELAQMEKDQGGAMKAIWKQVAPPPPAWIQQIVDAQQPWGFVFYKNRVAEQELGHDWEDVWSEIKHSIHTGGNERNMRRLWTTDWAAGPIDPDLLEDDALRQHFKEYKESLSYPGILRNTFIMIDDQCIPADLWKYTGRAIDTFWVWAYDADWEPSSTDATVSNGEEYRGRVRVPLYSLNAWFYGARSEGEMENWHHESYI